MDAKPLEVAGQTRSLFELIAGPCHSLFIFAEAEAHGRRHANAAHLAEEVARVYGDLIRSYFVLSADADAAAFKDVPAAIVRDVESRMHQRYAGQAGQCYLIRPDGYVGWRCDRPSLIDLRDCLARVLVSG